MHKSLHRQNLLVRTVWCVCIVSHLLRDRIESINYKIFAHAATWQMNKHRRDARSRTYTHTQKLNNSHVHFEATDVHDNTRQKLLHRCLRFVKINSTFAISMIRHVTQNSLTQTLCNLIVSAPKSLRNFLRHVPFHLIYLRIKKMIKFEIKCFENV